MKPGNTVERTGCYRCVCEGGSYEERDFKEGDVFPQCPTCGERSSWVFVRPSACHNGSSPANQPTTPRAR